MCFGRQRRKDRCRAWGVQPDLRNGIGGRPGPSDSNGARAESGWIFALAFAFSNLGRTVSAWAAIRCAALAHSIALASQRSRSHTPQARGERKTAAPSRIDVTRGMLSAPASNASL